MEPHSEVRRRRRRILSCLQCRRRKIKCNRQQPCNYCIETQQSCTYQAPLSPQPWQLQPSKKVAKPPPSNNNSWRSVILSAEDGGVAPGSSQAAAASAYAGVADAGDAGPAPTPPASSQGTPASLPTPGTCSINPNEAYASPQPLQHDAHILARRSAAHDSQIVLDKTRILRWSHWMGAGQEFGVIFHCYMEIIEPRQDSTLGPEVKAVLAEAGEVLQKCKRLARSSKVWRPSRLFGVQDYDLTPPPREVADIMAREYFQYFESGLRVLHIPSFWSSYEEFWKNPNSVKIETRIIILLVIAIGSSFQDRNAAATDKVPSIPQIHQWIYAAQTWLAGPLEKDRLDMGGLQAYCLLIMARQIYSVGGDLVWMSLGSLLHRAMQLGMHYDPKHFHQMSIFTSELRRRLWYTILELLMQAALDTAMPPRISPDEFDTEPPSNINDSDLHPDTKTLHPRPDSEYTDTFVHLQLINSLLPRIRIIRYLNSIKTDLSYPEAMTLSSALSAAHRKSTQALQAHTAQTTPFQRNMVDFLIRRFVVPLHSPFACEARTSPAFHYSLKACTEASLALICPEPDARFSRILEFGGGLFREGLRSANTAISLDLIIQTKTQQVDGTLHRTRTYRGALKQSVFDMLELCNKRIYSGETNVKSYVFLAMVLAMTDAMENGVPTEIRVADSARDALTHCYGVLESSIGSRATNTPTEAGFSSTGLEEGFMGMDMGMDFFFSDVGFS